MHHQPFFFQCSCLSCVLCFLSKPWIYFYTAQEGSRGSKGTKAMLS